MKSSVNRSARIVLIILTIILLGVLSFLIFKFSESSLEAFVSAPSARGEVFRISSGEKTGPRITDGFIDPYLPSFGDRQIFSIHVKDSAPIQSVSATLITDSGSSRHELRLMDGTNMDGVWQGVWRVWGTRHKAYNIIIESMSASGISKVEITLPTDK